MLVEEISISQGVNKQRRSSDPAVVPPKDKLDTEERLKISRFGSKLTDK